MCGRSYQSYTPEELYMRYIWQKSKRKPLDSPALAGFKPCYNFAPTMKSPVVTTRNGERQIEMMRWGLVPSYEPEFKTKLSTFNAKAETLLTSRLFKTPALRHRCIWPISGFYEWKREGDQKRPFAIRMKDDPMMSVAGVWEAWHPGSSEEQLSFSVITMPANPFMNEVHDRMPFILDGVEAEDAWLNSTLDSPDDIRALIKPVEGSHLQKHEVSTMVNSSRNDRPELLEPVKSASS